MLAILLLLSPTPAFFQDPIVDKESATVPSFASLEADWGAAMGTWMEKMQAMQESGKWEVIPMPTQEYFKKFRVMAKDVAVSADDRGRAQLWCLENFGQSGIRWRNPEAAAAGLVRMFLKEFAETELAHQLPPLIGRLGWELGEEVAFELLDEAFEFGGDPEFRGMCLLTKARILAESEQDEKALQVLRDLKKAYPGSRAASKADSHITRIEGLKIGGTPPDFEGQTVDGKKIALSDYRGKVTFLVFWGFW